MSLLRQLGGTLSPVMDNCLNIKKVKPSSQDGGGGGGAQVNVRAEPDNPSGPEFQSPTQLMICSISKMQLAQFSFSLKSLSYKASLPTPNSHASDFFLSLAQHPPTSLPGKFRRYLTIKGALFSPVSVSLSLPPSSLSFHPSQTAQAKLQFTTMVAWEEWKMIRTFRV